MEFADYHAFDEAMKWNVYPAFRGTLTSKA